MRPDGKALSDLPSWPPRMTWSFGHALAVEESDKLLAIEWAMPAEGLIGLRLVKAGAEEYGVELSLPAEAVEGALQAIRPGMALLAIGRLKPAELPLPVEGQAPPKPT